MHREDRNCRIKRVREKRQMACSCLNNWRGIFASLPNHCDRRLNTDNEAVFRLIRTCPGPHVYNALHSGKLLSDQLFNSWIGVTVIAVASAYQVVRWRKLFQPVPADWSPMVFNIGDTFRRRAHPEFNGAKAVLFIKHPSHAVFLVRM